MIILGAVFSNCKQNSISFEIEKRHDVDIPEEIWKGINELAKKPVKLIFSSSDGIIRELRGHLQAVLITNRGNINIRIDLYENCNSPEPLQKFQIRIFKKTDIQLELLEDATPENTHNKNISVYQRFRTALYNYLKERHPNMTSNEFRDELYPKAIKKRFGVEPGEHLSKSNIPENKIEEATNNLISQTKYE